jgi:hypothetical protein
MIGGISAGGILGAKAVVKYKGGKKEGNINVDKGVEKDNPCFVDSINFNFFKNIILFYAFFK